MTANLCAENSLPVCYADVVAAAKRLNGKCFKTPVLTSATFNKRTNSQVFFKCENFQRTGSFKFRGACNALMQLSAAEKQRGVLTFSSGNHAQAIALAAQLLQIPATVVMPADAPKVKQEATRGYGAEIILYDRTQVSREDLTAQIGAERNLTIIPPYDDARVIAGQGTTALELIAEVGELDLLLVCCGGGGLLSGCAIATKTLSPQCKVIGVEPAQADDAARSFRTKTLQTVTNPDTIADGARTPSLGKLTFPLVLHYVDDMATVSEDAIRSTMFFMWERMKIVVEPTGVLAAAALFDGIVKAENARIGVIVSGGNVEILDFRF
ncbi:MAG: threo-3-hydroxy-L-aspartate ammonia-lyase [Microcoleus sp. CSU_2_2]|nr:threo-3-hydroxy-L-aspartate ammonia-lyase [Microcoleus sp. SU_5_3]NJS12593.1 threo-3-hydroxy-L-aspartate ammonia-lyase [Microcoleus sp. CSU_2_2]